MDKDWLIGLGFGIGALGVLVYIWHRFISVEVTFEEECEDEHWW